MKRWLLLLIAALAAPLAAYARPEAPSVTVIDRTVVCEAGLYGGIPKLHIVATSAIPSGPQERTAEISVVTKAGRPGPDRLTGVGRGYMDLSPQCKRSTARVPLTSRGLSGFVASQFEDDLGCLTPARVLIRVRAVFPGRASLRLGAPIPNSPRVWYAIAPVDKGEIAVRTIKGKPIAYESFSSKTGKARLFTRGSCG
jgi:hypothetical protein